MAGKTNSGFFEHCWVPEGEVDIGLSPYAEALKKLKYYEDALQKLADWPLYSYNVPDDPHGLAFLMKRYAQQILEKA